MQQLKTGKQPCDAAERVIRELEAEASATRRLRGVTRNLCRDAATMEIDDTRTAFVYEGDGWFVDGFIYGVYRSGFCDEMTREQLAHVLTRAIEVLHGRATGVRS